MYTSHNQISRSHPHYLFSEDSLSYLDQACKSPTLSLRVYDLIAQVALLSDTHFELCSSSGVLQKLVGDLTSSDVLAVLGIVEIFTQVSALINLTLQMVTQPFGYLFLERADVIKDLYAILCRDATEDITDYLVLCAAVKFWAALAVFQVGFLRDSRSTGSGNHARSRIV